MAQPLHPSRHPVVFLRVLPFHLPSSLYKWSSSCLVPRCSLLCWRFNPTQIFFHSQPSSNARSQSWLSLSSTISLELQSILRLRTCFFLVKFDTCKKQILTLSLSNTPSNHPILFEESDIYLKFINILRIQLSFSLPWRGHIVQIAEVASKKLRFLFWCKWYLNSTQLFKWYTGFICLFLEYCSHISGVAYFPFYFSC